MLSDQALRGAVRSLVVLKGRRRIHAVGLLGCIGIRYLVFADVANLVAGFVMGFYSEMVGDFVFGFVVGEL